MSDEGEGADYKAASSDRAVTAQMRFREKTRIPARGWRADLVEERISRERLARGKKTAFQLIC